MTDDTQLGAAIEKIGETVADVSPDENRDAPLVPFPSALALTRDQEKKMIEHAFKRFQQLDNDSGRSQTITPNWWLTTNIAPSTALASQGLQPGETFLGKRSRYDATFYNDVSWRPYSMGVGSIFWDSNLVVPLSRRIARQMIARAKNSFFDSDPWFSVDPAPEPASAVDEHLALQIERFCRYKLHEADSKIALGRAISRALVLGECAVKTTYVVRDQIFNTEGTVLHTVDGAPAKGADGNLITPDDKYEDAEDGIGTQVLSRDKAKGIDTPHPTSPDAPIWQNAKITRRQVLFEGAKSETIYYKDFLCPLTAADVQTADCCIHIYDKPVMEFVDLAVKRGMVSDNADGRKDAAARFHSLVSKLDANSNAPKAAASQDLRPGENFQVNPAGLQDTTGPQAEFIEFYMWFDADGDGVAENIMLIADRKTQAPVFYDHIANVTVDGLRPIEIVRINPIEGRWYGQGIMELFESYQTVTDLMVNRWNFSQSRSGRVEFWNPGLTLEGDRNPNLQMNFGGTYTLKNGAKAEDALNVVYLNDTKFEQIKTMIQFFMQLAMNESGVTNANDDQAAGMQSAKLATGIQNVQASGDELFKPIIADLTPAINAIVNREIAVTMANMDGQEAFSYLEGDTMGIDQLDSDAVRGLKLKVRIELTTHKNQQILQYSAQSAALVEKFYMLDPMIQMRVAPFYRAQIRALDPKCNVDEVIVAMQPQLPCTEPEGDEGNGSTQKLGDSGAGGSTPFSTQLSQAPSEKV